MSANLKSGNAIVRFLLAHGEKIGILAIIVCTGLVIWSAMGHERMEREPGELSSLAQQTSSKITSYTWNALSEEERLKAQPVSASAMANVLPDNFPNFKNSFDPPVSDPVTLRTDPVLLSPLDLEVHADAGLWASANPQLIRKRALEAEKEKALQEQEREEARLRAQRDAGKRRGSQGGGLYGGEGYGLGGFGGTRDGGRVAKDAPIVQRPRMGVQLQGYEEITAKSWVTVLAKIPIEQQMDNYFEALGGSRSYSSQKDIPEYIGYQVQRAPVTGKGLGEWQTVATINAAILVKEIATYPVNASDVIDRDVNHPLLTHPLPPLILREWGNRVSHSSMPLAEEKMEQEAEALKEPEEVEEPEQEPKGDEDLFGEADPQMASRGGTRSEYGSMGREYGGGMGRGFGGGMMEEYGGEYGGGMMGEFGGEYGGGMMGEYGGGFGGMGGSLGRGSAVTLDQFVWDQETPHILFRYFDNSVSPGESYRYRVRLVLRDANHKVKVQYLDNSVTQRRAELSDKQKSFRWTEWSEPSPVASVPMPARVYLVSAEPAKESNYTAEPEVEILIKALDSEYAAEVARLEPFSRGSVINMNDKATVVWSADRFDLEKTPSFDFSTGITVVDFSGGKKLNNKNRDMVEPARALLMDAAGHLFVQSEMDDLEVVEEYQAIIEAGKNDRNRNRGGSFGGEYGGGMMEEFGVEGF